MPKKISNIPSPSEYRDYITKDGYLYVGIIATHAGFINQNNFYYIPSRMKDSVNTWTDKYNKPILYMHNSESEPIGRVIKAEFRTTNENASTLISYLSSNDFKDEVEKNIKYIKENKEIINDSANALGYIYLIARVTDQEAISKILDGRYRTVSVGASTDASICSICGANWSANEYCEHEPYMGGVDDEGNPICFIAGNFEYKEVSIVNKPADTDAIIADVYTEDEINVILSSNEIQDSQKYNKENNMPKDKNTNINDATKEALEKENTSLKEQIADLEKQIESLKAQLKDVQDQLKAKEDVTKKLTDELKEVYFGKLYDLLSVSGKVKSIDEVKEKYGEKTLDQLKDYIALLSDVVVIEDEESKEESKEEEKKEKEEVEDEEKEKEFEDKKEGVEDNFKEKKTENTSVEIPVHVRREAARIALTDGENAANEYISNWIKENLK